MKLYICLTTYHMLAACALAIRESAHASELLVESFLNEETELVRTIRESNIFRNVYVVNQADAWIPLNRLDAQSSPVEITNAVRTTVRFWKEHFVHFRHITKRYHEIHIMDDHFTLGMALAYLHIPYHYYEDSPGCHCRREVFLQLSDKAITNRAYALVARQFGLRGLYAYAEAYHYDFSLNPMKHREHDQDFSLVKELTDIRKLEPESFAMLKKVFAPGDYIAKEYGDPGKRGKENVLLIG